MPFKRHLKFKDIGNQENTNQKEAGLALVNTIQGKALAPIAQLWTLLPTQWLAGHSMTQQEHSGQYALCDLEILD